MHKNMWWNLLLALTVCVSIVIPGKNVFAAGPDAVYPVYFGGIHVDSLNKDDIMNDGGSVSYDPDEHTLYIRDYSIQSTDPTVAIRVEESYADFTIDVSGNVSLAGDGAVEYGIAAHSSDVTITSSDGTGSLEVRGAYAGISACNLTINGNVTVDTQSERYGILLEQNFTMNAGYLTAIGDSEDGIASYFEQDKGTFKFNGGEAHIRGGKAGIDCISYVMQKLGTGNPVVTVYGEGCGVRATDSIKVYGGALEADSGEGEPGIGVFVSGEDGEISMEDGIVKAKGDAIGIQTTYLWMNGGYISGDGNNTGIYINTEMDVTGGELTADGGEYGIKSVNGEFIFYDTLKRVRAEGGSRAILTNGRIMNEAHILIPEGGDVIFPDYYYFIDAEGYPATKVVLGKTVRATYKPGEGTGNDLYVNATIGEPMSILPYPEDWTTPGGQHFAWWIMHDPEDRSFLAEQIDKGEAVYTPMDNMILTAEYGYWITHYEDTAETSAIRHVNVWGDGGYDHDPTTEPSMYMVMPPGINVGVTVYLYEEEDAIDSTAYLVGQDGTIITTITMKREISSYNGVPYWSGSYTVPNQDHYLRFETISSETPTEYGISIDG